MPDRKSKLEQICVEKGLKMTEQRRVIVLAYFGGMSQSEISNHIAVPLGTVKKRIRLGLQKLRASLSPHALLDFDGDDDEEFDPENSRPSVRIRKR